MFVFCFLWIFHRTSWELNLSTWNIKFYCPHLQWWFAMQIVGLVAHGTITMVTKWRQVCFTSSAKYFPALHSDVMVLPTVKGIKGTARGFIEIKAQLEPLYSFPAPLPWVPDSLLIAPTISNYFLTDFLEGRVERFTVYLYPQLDCRFWQAHCPGFPPLTSNREQIETWSLFCGHEDFLVLAAVMLKETGRRPNRNRHFLRTATASCKGHFSAKIPFFW